MLNLRRGARGYSLLEVLIALVVFSIGLLGVVTLQAVSKKATYDAVQRMSAALLANDLLERMRANPTVLDRYLGIFGTAPPPLPAVDCATTGCTPAQLAAHDLWEFSQVINGALETSASGDTGGISEPTFCVGGPADGSSGNYEVTIAWRGRSIYPSRPAHLCGVGRYGEGEGSRRLLTFVTFVDAEDG